MRNVGKIEKKEKTKKKDLEIIRQFQCFKPKTNKQTKMAIRLAPIAQSTLLSTAGCLRG